MVTVIVSSTTAAPHRIGPPYYKKVDLRWRFWFWAPSARGILPRPTCSDHQAIHHQLTSDVCRQPSYSAGNCDVRRCVQGTQTAAPHVSLRRRQIWSSGGWDAVRDVCPPSIDWRGVEVGGGIGAARTHSDGCRWDPLLASGGRTNIRPGSVKAVRVTGGVSTYEDGHPSGRWPVYGGGGSAWLSYGWWAVRVLIKIAAHVTESTAEARLIEATTKHWKQLSLKSISFVVFFTPLQFWTTCTYIRPTRSWPFFLSSSAWSRLMYTYRVCFDWAPVNWLVCTTMPFGPCINLEFTKK